MMQHPTSQYRLEIVFLLLLAALGNNCWQMSVLSIQLNQFETQIQSLANAPSGSSSAKRESTELEATFNHAENLLNEGDLEGASLYFSHAIFHAQGHWPLLLRYHQAMLAYCIQLNENGQMDTALNTLSEVEVFLRAQSIYLPMTDLNDLQNALQELNQARESILQQADQPAQTPSGTLEMTPEAEEEKHVLDSIETLTQRVKHLLNKAEKEPLESDFVMYYLSSADALIQQMVMIAPGSVTIKNQIETLSNRLERIKADISDKRSQAVWKDVDEQIVKYKAKKFKKYQGDIDEVNKLRELILNRLNQISSPKLLEHAQEMLKISSDHLQEQQTQQLIAYDHWAMGQIKECYRECEKINKETLSLCILDHLGDIDVRYLSQPVSAAYYEVFNLFYGKLEEEQKIDLSANMATRRKKSLSDF